VTPRLYFSPGACSMAAHIALEEASASFEAIPVLLAKGENRSAGYLAVNPRGLVPVLEVDGEYLTEAVAILLYIARRFPEANLLPATGTMQEARVFEWLAFLTNTVHVAYAALWRPRRFTDDEAAAEIIAEGARGRIDALNRDIEKKMETRSFAIGSEYSVADPFLLVFFRWANRVGLAAAERYPAWTTWAQHMEKRRAVARVLAKEGISLWE